MNLVKKAMKPTEQAFQQFQIHNWTFNRQVEANETLLGKDKIIWVQCGLGIRCFVLKMAIDLTDCLENQWVISPTHCQVNRSFQNSIGKYRKTDHFPDPCALSLQQQTQSPNKFEHVYSKLKERQSSHNMYKGALLSIVAYIVVR